LNKTFVIDTNVFLQDAYAIHSFQEHDIYVPLAVLEELDKFKHRQDLLGKHSRVFSRLLDELRSQGSLIEGVPSKGGLFHLVNRLSRTFLMNSIEM